MRFSILFTIVLMLAPGQPAFAEDNAPKLGMKVGHIYKNIISEPGGPDYVPVPKGFRID